jgi:hypothetical protein
MKYNSVVKHKKEVTKYIFLCFTTHSCTSCTLSPLFYISLHTAVLHVHCHLFFYVSLHTAVLHVLCHHNVHEVQLCVVKYKKEVTMYMKYNCV